MLLFLKKEKYLLVEVIFLGSLEMEMKKVRMMSLSFLLKESRDQNS